MTWKKSGFRNSQVQPRSKNEHIWLYGATGRRNTLKKNICRGGVTGIERLISKISLKKN